MVNEVIENMPYREYAAKGGLRSHVISGMNISAGHCKYYETHPKKETDAMRLGRAVHCLTAQPELYAGEFAIMPKFGTTKAEKEQKAAWKALHADKTILNEDDAELARMMAHAILSHPKASNFYKIGKPEVSFFWTDKETGLYCQGRADILIPDKFTLVDTKTTGGLAEAESFSYEIEKWYYAHQMAFYKSGLEACGLRIDHAWFVVVEKDAPHGVKAFRLTDNCLRLAHEDVRAMLKKYATYKNLNQWPVYSPEPEDIGWPLRTTQRMEEMYGI